jgi:hypothetical protein
VSGHTTPRPRGHYHNVMRDQKEYGKEIGIEMKYIIVLGQHNI